MAQTIQVKLNKLSNGQAWGFRLTGGVEFGSPLSILKVLGGSPAEKAGLCPGDVILSVQDQDATAMTHKDVQIAVNNCGTAFQMMIQRGGAGWKPVETTTIPTTMPTINNEEKRSFGYNSTQKSYTKPTRPISTHGNHIQMPVDANRKLVVSTYNSPIGLYSEDTIAETLSSQAEVLGGKCLGIDFKKNEKQYDGHNSEVLKMVQDMDKGVKDHSPSPVPVNLLGGGRSYKIVNDNIGVGTPPSEFSPGQRAAAPEPPRQAPTFNPVPAPTYNSAPASSYSPIPYSSAAAAHTFNHVAAPASLSPQIPYGGGGLQKSSVIEDKMSRMSLGSHGKTTSYTQERRIESFCSSSYQGQNNSSVGAGAAPTSPVVWPPPRPDALPASPTTAGGKNVSFAGPASPSGFEAVKQHPLSVIAPVVAPAAPSMQSVYKSPLISPSAGFKAPAAPPVVPPAAAAGGLSVGKPLGKRNLSTTWLPTRGRGTFMQPGARIPVCSCCQTTIRGPFVTALNKTWCPAHFSCVRCGKDLKEQGFVEEAEKLHCEQCWESFLAPICAKCGGKVIGECLKAIGRHWHPQCFVCTHCKTMFGNQHFFLEDGMPFCEEHWNALFTTKCIGCGFPIEAGDRWIEALNSSYHTQCFKCSLCHKSLEGQSFLAKKNKPFCKSHGRG